MTEINSGFTEDIFSRVVYEDECTKLDFEPNTCSSGAHEYGDNSCTYLDPENNDGTPAAPGGTYTTTLKPCDMPTGDVTPDTSNPSNQGPHGSVGNGGNTSSPTTCAGSRKCVPVGTGPILTQEQIDQNNCDKLNNQIDPTKANIKPAIVALQANLNQQGETGKSLKKDQNGVYSNPNVPTTQNLEIQVKSGEYYYGSIHVHPYPIGTPAFSWADVFSLLKFYDKATFGNQQEVTIVLVCKDNSGVNQVYSLVVDDRQTLADAILNEVGAIPNVGNMNLKSILKYMDQKLTTTYSKNPNKELAFLNRFANYGISLYKANSTITNWSKLTPNNSNTTPPVIETPCN